jgi:hypothetical protein
VEEAASYSTMPRQQVPPKSQQLFTNDISYARQYEFSSNCNKDSRFTDLRE